MSWVPNTSNLVDFSVKLIMINEQFSDVNLINKLICLVFQTIFFIDTIIAIIVSTKFRITKDCFISIAIVLQCNI